ncbi:peptidase S8-like protein [Leptotrombidium deliense]|uniref:Peptidase S8-like protein n=1 Tax=Leptotrombidium deliense TaxID=299467 RepID=A0A443QIW9_9ACAR|nr:peptidase S8-like protein [Leptotrombidium deliense]
MLVTNFGIPVDIFAPGVDCYFTKYTAGYFTISGTSMATPTLAGWAATLKRSNSSSTAATIRDKLIQLFLECRKPFYQILFKLEFGEWCYQKRSIWNYH